jgi:hypothetical protein
MKLLQGNMGKILEDTALGNYFLNRIPTAQETRGRTDKLDYIKF